MSSYVCVSVYASRRGTLREVPRVYSMRQLPAVHAGLDEVLADSIVTFNMCNMYIYIYIYVYIYIYIYIYIHTYPSVFVIAGSILRDIVSFPSELCRRRGSTPADVTRLLERADR